jgi:hypothetical protein
MTVDELLMTIMQLQDKEGFDEVLHSEVLIMDSDLQAMSPTLCSGVKKIDWYDGYLYIEGTK